MKRLLMVLAVVGMFGGFLGATSASAAGPCYGGSPYYGESHGVHGGNGGHGSIHRYPSQTWSHSYNHGHQSHHQVAPYGYGVQQYYGGHGGHGYTGHAVRRPSVQVHTPGFGLHWGY